MLLLIAKTFQKAKILALENFKLLTSLRGACALRAQIFCTFIYIYFLRSFAKVVSLQGYMLWLALIFDVFWR